jgi:hypothetical protein
MLMWDRFEFYKNTTGDITLNLCFLHPAQNVDTLFFMLGWDQCSFHKKRARTHYVKLVFCIQWDMQAT